MYIAYGTDGLVIMDYSDPVKVILLNNYLEIMSEE